MRRCHLQARSRRASVLEPNERRGAVPSHGVRPYPIVVRVVSWQRSLARTTRQLTREAMDVPGGGRRRKRPAVYGEHGEDPCAPNCSARWPPRPRSTQVFDPTRETGLPRGIRTPDPRLRRPMLYPTELWADRRSIITERSEPAALAGSLERRAAQAANRCGLTRNQPRHASPAITQYTPNDVNRPRPSK